MFRRPEHRLHPQVQRLLEGEPEAGSPEAAILARVRRQIETAQSFGWGGPPFDIERLASLLGLRVEYTDNLPCGQCGAIIAGAPVRIIVSSSISKARQRYTIAHEIAHTLIPGVFDGRATVGWVYRLDGQSPIELLCQLAASEFLMPTASAEPLLIGRSLLGATMEVRETFHVSHEAALRKVVRLTAKSAAGMMLRHCNKPSEMSDPTQPTLFGDTLPLPSAKLRISYAFSAANGPYLPGHKSIPDASGVYQLLGASRGASVHLVEDWRECFGWKETVVEALRLGQDREALEVLCVIVAPEA